MPLAEVIANDIRSANAVSACGISRCPGFVQGVTLAANGRSGLSEKSMGKVRELCLFSSPASEKEFRFREEENTSKANQIWEGAWRVQENES